MVGFNNPNFHSKFPVQILSSFGDINNLLLFSPLIEAVVQKKSLQMEILIRPYQSPPSKDLRRANHFSLFKAVFDIQPFFINQKIAGRS